MTNIREISDSFPPVPLLERGLKIEGGGEESSSNKQATALVQRTAHIKTIVDDLREHGMYFMGALSNTDALKAIDTTSLKQWSAYFIQGSLFVWDGNAWSNPDLPISTDPGNALTLGKDGKFYVSTDIDADLVQSYNEAKGN